MRSVNFVFVGEGAANLKRNPVSLLVELKDFMTPTSITLLDLHQVNGVLLALVEFGS